MKGVYKVRKLSSGRVIETTIEWIDDYGLFSADKNKKGNRQKGNYELLSIEKETIIDKVRKIKNGKDK